MASLGVCERHGCGDRAWEVTVDEAGALHAWCGLHHLDAVRGGPVSYTPPPRAAASSPGREVLEVATFIGAGLLVLAAVVCLVALLAIEAGIEVAWGVHPLTAFGVIGAVTTGCWVALRTLESRPAAAAAA